MNNKLVALIFLLCSFTGKAQQTESCYLYSDRDIYASGETMLLKVFLPQSEVSGIMHLDLLNLSGNKIQGVNIKIRNHQADGFLELNDSLSSGTYLVRASSRASGIHTIKEIFIANRFNDNPLSNTIQSPSETAEPMPGNFTAIEIDGIEKTYKTRSTGHFSLKLPDELMDQTPGNLLVEIVDSTLLYSTKTFSTEAKSTEAHLVEKEGIILEGLVTDLTTNQPFNKAIVYLTIRDSIPEFNYYLTGSDGRFYFELKNHSGRIPLVIQCFDNKTNRQLKISLIDPESLKSDVAQYKSQEFPSGVQKAIQKNREAASFQKIFGQEKLILEQHTNIQAEPFPFYGNPTYTVDPGLFVDLANFSEISKELLPGVKFRAYNRNPTMQVFNPVTQSYFQETPLVVMDGIPVRDLNVIKNLGSKQIDKVEVCQSERFYGNLIFPGVVAIHCSKSDNSNIPIGDDVIELNFEAIQNNSKMYIPSGKPIHEPDLRQILLWDQNIKPGKQIDFDFLTSDIQGKFKLIVRGRHKDGSAFCVERQFEVK